MFTVPDAQRINRTVGAVEHQLMPIRPNIGTHKNLTPQTFWYWAKLGGDLHAGTLESPTTFHFDVWVPDPTSMTNPKAFIVSPDSTLVGVAGTNRSPFTARSGTVIKVEYSYGEWSPKWEPTVWYWGKTTSAIAAATSLSVASTYTADLWLPTGTSAGGTYAVSSMTNLTIQNRDPNFSTTTTGLTGRFEFAWYEWTGLIGCG
jgi:hypothetical protein